MPAKKTTTTKKGSSSRSKKAARERAKRKARRQVWGVCLFALGIFLGALALVSGQNVWLWLHQALFGLFGWCAFLVPVAVLFLAVECAQDRDQVAVHALECGVLLLLLCGITQIFGDGLPTGGDTMEKIASLFEGGMALSGGGFFAAPVGLTLLSLFGRTGAAVTAILLLFVFVMLVTGLTLMQIFQAAKKPVQKISNTISDTYTHAVEQRQSRPRREIDIPVEASGKQVDQGPEPVQLKEGPVAHRTQRPKFTVDIPLDTWEAPSKDVSPDHAPEETQEPPVEPQIDDIIRKVVKAPVPERPAPPTVEGLQLDADPTQEPPKEDVPQMEQPQEGQEVLMPDPPAPRPYVFPPIQLLKEPVRVSQQDLSEELRANAELLVDTLKSFGVQTRIIDISRGPAVTRYELQPSAGVKISKITNLADDIALNLAAAGVRIEAPIPNKAAVGIEVPNKAVVPVPIREIIDSNEFTAAKSKLSVALGKDIAGQLKVADLAKMPHLLIAGATGSGKSVGINSIILSLRYKATPQEVKLLMIDPKVVELGVYNGIPHLLVPVVTDPKKAAGALGWAVKEMLQRYKLFADNGVRDLNGFNQLAQDREDLEEMPQIAIIIDELADLMMAAPRDVEDHICRLAQMARAAGMHLIIATQRPSVDVITGIIKANIPSRIAFSVSSQVDSRTILDMAGAEKLLGKGDMLYYPVGDAKPTRIQGCFVTDKEVEQVVSFIKESAKATYDDQILTEIEANTPVEKGESSGNGGGGFSEDDSILPAAIECVVEAGQASTSLLQRRLRLGYARAARVLDELEQRGIVGPFEGSKPRTVLLTKERWIEMKLNKED